MITSSSIVHRISPGLAPDVHVIEQMQQNNSAMINVAAYCRVSTDLDVQKKSLETQIAVFQKTIAEHPGWVLAGIYADRGISGTSVRHREEFQRMIEDAKAGKIQCILVKSISRFSRNTLDALAYVRELKRYGVSVFFDEEKLDTGSMVSEFILSILAASAQEQIISLSNNMKVGRRMRNAAGQAQWSHAYGFRKGEDGNWVIEEGEAEIVRRIFRDYAAGMSLPEICKALEADGVPTVRRKERWFQTTISDILHNEKYAGNLLMQKSFISDPIEHTRVDNRDAKIKQYYKENNHPAIVDQETWQMVQIMSAMRDLHRGCVQYPFYGFLKCPICGQNLVRFLHPRNTKTYAWTCGGVHSEKGNLRRHRSSCPPFSILESYIRTAFQDALEMAGHALPESGKIEYKTLHDLVEKITFPQWSDMRVKWKNGTTSDVRIEYKKLSDQPYPTIDRTSRPCESENCGTLMVNGKPIVLNWPGRQMEGLKHAQQEVLDLTILDPEPYEAPVPKVYGKRTTSRKSGKENAAANRAKATAHREKSPTNEIKEGAMEA